jgi:4-hydroxy-tetrahydrodipicolinate synthase
MECLLAGAVGVISVTANVAPAAMSALCAACLTGDAASAARINRPLESLHRDLFVEANPIPVKWALAEMGLIGTGIRLPLTWLSEQYHALLRAALQSAGLV